MALSVVDRPYGFELGTAIAACIYNVYGNALVQQTAHGLSTGRYVYIRSDVSAYNGFWYVQVFDANAFYIRKNAGAANVAWIRNTCSVTYYACTTHNWSCVHLPIIYRLQSNKWPTNSVDTIRTVSSTANEFGFTELSLSGAINSVAGDTIKVTVNSVAGLYKIIAYTSSSQFVINLDYDAGNTFGNVQDYANNYHARVRIYSGLDIPHTYQSMNPYAQAVEIKAVPDENGLVTVNINEYLKQDIKILTNDLILGSRPNNTDAYCQFYVEYAESYDDSDGTEVGTFVSSYTSDKTNFQGYAVNAKLPFKNIHAGSLTDYLMNKTTAKFLTLFTIPVIFACEDDGTVCYNDISFLNPGTYPAGLLLRQTYYSNGVEQATTDLQITDSATPGVYTVQPTNPSCNHDRVDLTLISNEENGGTDPILTLPFAQAQQTSSANVNWTNSAILTPEVLLTSGQDSERAYFQKTFYAGRQYRVTLSSTRVSIGGSGNTSVEINLHTGLFSSPILTTSQEWANSLTITFTLSQNATHISFLFDRAAGGGGYEFRLSSLTIASETISETKQIEINCKCFNQNIHLGWLNYLGGFDYWSFQSGKDYLVDIGDTTEANKNILTDWPNTYGEFADTLKYETSRESTNQIRVRSQYVTQSQIDAIRYIKSSPLVQIINDADDRRTVIVDTDSFTIKRDEDKLYSIEFTVTYTDPIPSQSL